MTRTTRTTNPSTRKMPRKVTRSAAKIPIVVSARKGESFYAFFPRAGSDVFCRAPISMVKAALGGHIDVPTLEETVTRVKIPAGTESGKQFRLKGKGMPVLRTKMTGDMYIQVDVETPKNLTKRQRELLEEFEKESKNDTSPESAGFFAKVKDFFEGG